MTDQPRAEANRYARLGPEAQALVDDHDQIDLAELLVKAHDELERARQELADQAAADSADAAAGSYAGRAERVEAQLARVTALYERWVKAGPPPLGASMARWWDRRLVELHDAILPPVPPAPRDPCPHCESSSDRIPRAEMGQHIADVHPEVKAAGRSKEQP